MDKDETIADPVCFCSDEICNHEGIDNLIELMNDQLSLVTSLNCNVD